MEHKTTNWITLILKGVGMGAANVIPGVSGGTIAFITGIYERLVAAINNIDRDCVKLLFTGKLKELWKHIDGNFLLAVLIGIGIATFSLAKLMLILLGGYPIQTWAFFFGLIIASSILMLREMKGWCVPDFAWLAFGIALGVFICTLKGIEYTPDSLWFIFICGALSICAMILPGISGSFILLVLGKYEYIMESITGVLRLDGHCIIVLLVFALGCATGILAFAKFLHWLLAKWNRQTLTVLCGFVLGSLVKVWPWNSYDANADVLFGESQNIVTGDPHILAAIICCAAGIVLVLGLEWLGQRNRQKE